MPGRETASGFVVSDVPQQDQDLHAARKQAASALIPAIILRVDIRCYLRRIAAHVLVFAREIPRPCKFRCSLQRALLILQANFDALGSSNEPESRNAKLLTAVHLQVELVKTSLPARASHRPRRSRCDGSESGLERRDRAPAGVAGPPAAG